MGFNVYMKIFAKCPFVTFLEENQKNFLIKTDNDEAFQKYLPIMREKYSHILCDKLKFFKLIDELEFENFQLSVSSENLIHPDEDFTDREYEELYNYNTSIFVTHFFFELILEAIKTNDPNTKEYFTVFSQDWEKISIEKNNIQINLYYGSSYKCSGSLNIDYSKVNDDINNLKLKFPSIKVKTVLGIS